MRGRKLKDKILDRSVSEIIVVYSFHMEEGIDKERPRRSCIQV